MAEPPRFEDEDESFKEWARSRQPDAEPSMSASAAFLDMMRAAAERKAAAARPPTPPSAPEVPPAPVVEAPPTDLFAPPFAPPPAPPPANAAPDDFPFTVGSPESAAPDAAPDDTAVDPDEAERDAQRYVREIEALTAVERPRRSRTERFDLVDDETGMVRRPKRRLRRGRRAVSMVGGLVRAVFIIFTAGFLVATIFTWWTPPGFLPSSVRQDLALGAAAAPSAAAPMASPMPTPNWALRVGVVSGHRGPQNDPGAVCPDGLTERETVFNVAQVVVANLQRLGYTVDLLDEFDPRLQSYQAAALLSIHANTCREWPNGEIVSGYLIAAPAARITARGNDDLLVDCVSRAYAAATELERREGTTIDMTDYHNFREIHPLTPGAIIELGFMRADRELLLQSERLGQALTQGMLCFLEPLRYQTTPLAPGGTIPLAATPTPRS
jgi:N-acetylmuramoyl-L-alanine amidase